MVENITLINTVLKTKLKLSATESYPYILESVDWGQVTGTYNSYKYVGQIGESLEDVIVGTRPVSIIGWIIADDENDMSSRKWMLNLFFNPQQEIELNYEKYQLLFYPASSIKYGATVSENNEVMTKFKIDGTCFNPLFNDNSSIDIDAATTKGLFHFPLIINKDDQKIPQIVFGVREPSLIVTIVNNGQVETGFELLFVATSTVKNPALYNVSTQEYIKLNKTLVAGEKVRVNTSRGERKILGTLSGETKSYSKYRDLGMSWIQLKIGENPFRYDADENLEGLDVFINYSNKYLEVQKCF